MVEIEVEWLLRRVERRRDRQEKGKIKSFFFYNDTATTESRLGFIIRATCPACKEEDAPSIGSSGPAKPLAIPIDQGYSVLPDHGDRFSFERGQWIGNSRREFAECLGLLPCEDLPMGSDEIVARHVRERWTERIISAKNNHLLSRCADQDSISHCFLTLYQSI